MRRLLRFAVLTVTLAGGVDLGFLAQAAPTGAPAPSSNTLLAGGLNAADPAAELAFLSV